MTGINSQTTTFDGSPPAEVHIDEPLVRSLLKAQVPDLSEQALEFIEEGFDNVTYRLGKDKAVRVPRRAIAAKLIQNEQRWLSELAPSLPLPIPAPLHIGSPTDFYPWPWSIVPWFEGKPADLEAPGREAALTLAAFLNALHKPAPPDAPENEFRAPRLTSRASAVAPRIERLKEKTDFVTQDLEDLWHEALATPVDIKPTWIHGDLHARNVLVHEGQITAIIDWGDMTAADRAVDLASIWMLLGSKEARAAAIEAVEPVTQATWIRATGRAMFFGIFLLDSGLIDNPRHAEMGRRTLRRLAEDL